MTNRKYPKPIKKNGRFYCPVEGCNKDYSSYANYSKHYGKKHGDSSTINKPKKKKSKPETEIERIEQKSASKEEKLEEMYDTVRNFNKSLRSLEDSNRDITFDVSGDFIAVVGISDLHYGNVNVNMDFVDRLLNFVKNNEKVYCFLNGDILDNWVEIAPKGGIYEQTIKPEYQKEIMIHKLKPIKDKILAIVYGNHEGRSQKAGDKNPTKDMAERLDIPYLGSGGRINLNFGENTYKMHVRHKFRYESSFNPCHACGRLIEQLDSDADIVAIGHKHEPALEVRYKAGKQRSLIRFGSAMPSTNYSRYLGYDEMPLVAPTVVLSGKEFMHHPFIDIGVVKQYIQRRS